MQQLQRLIFLSITALILCVSPAGAENYRSLLPLGPHTDSIIHHQNYSLGYDEQTEQAEWVMYEFTPQEANNRRVKRKNNFRPDPAVQSGSAELADYKRSGFDRGHLAPAADMAFSKQAMSESFFMSNMSPQRPGFNRGVWKNLEAQVRTWAREEVIIITTGAVLSGGQYIGSNSVLVPEAYYKIIYAPQRQIMIGFLIPNEKSDSLPQHFIVPVDRIEDITGINFFAEMDDSIEEPMEGKAPLTAWTWGKVKAPTVTQRTSSPSHDIVKMSRSHICHESSSRHYRRTTNFTPYNTLQECLDAGGRLPKS